MPSRRIAVALLSGLLLLLSWFSGYGKDQPQAAPKRDDSQQGWKEKPPGYRFIHYEHPTEAEHRTAEQFAWRTAKNLGVWTGIAASIAAFFAFWTWLETKRQADTADLALRAVQRAFITASDYKIARLKDDTEPCWSFDPIISNTGETPTRDMRLTKEIVAMELSTPGEQGSANGMAMAPTDPEDTYRKFVGWTASLLGPKQNLPTTAETGRVCLTSEDRGSMWAHERIYVRGVIQYRDIFPASPEHVTKYCFWIQAEDNKGTYEPRPVLCSHWNCADDECERDKEAYEAELAQDFAETGQTPRPPVEWHLQ